MMERLLFWVVVLLPPLTVLGAALHGRWRGLPPARRMRELLIALAVVGAGLAGFLAWDLSRGMSAARLHFQNPFLLLGLLPVYGLLLFVQAKSLAGISRGRLWLAFLLRSSIFALLALALAGLQMFLEKDTLTVLFALDRSKSVPESEARRAMEFIRAAVPAKRADDKVGLLLFGGKAVTEVWPKEIPNFPDPARFHSQVEPDNTDLAQVAQAARATLEEGTAKRLVVFTDGRQTTGDALEAFKALKGTDVWFVPLQRGDAAEMLITKLEVPQDWFWEQPFDAKVFVYSNTSCDAAVNLYLNDKLSPDPPPQRVKLAANQKTPVFFRGLRLRSGGVHQIEARLKPLDPATDTLIENNVAYGFTDVQTDSRVLILTSDTAEVQYLCEALEGEKLELDVRSGGTLPANPEEYRRYDCIVLADLAQSFLGPEQMSVIESCVRDNGAGLVMLGGDQSFGAGNYLGTPIERALPVGMELRNREVLPSGALGLVLHTCEFPDGNAWGKKIAKAAINVLSDRDYAGLLYHGGFGGDTWLFRPTVAARRKWMFDLIDGFEPQDMFDLDAIVSMAVTALSNLPNVSLKHVIIITDGDPGPPGPATLNAALQAKITVSIVAIAPHGGADVSTMKSVATRTGGRYYNPTDPKKLPAIFIKEAAIVRKSLIYSDERGIPVTLGVSGEVLREFGRDFPKVRALVVTSPKNLAEMHLFTVVEGEKVPVLARWRYGLGKSIAFTSDATNRWAPDWVSWPGYRKFWANLFHWVCRQRAPLRHKIETRVEGNQAHVYVEIYDEKGQYKNVATLRGTASEPGLGREDVDAQTYSLHFSMAAPGRYETTFPVRRQGAYTLTLTDLTDPGHPANIVTGLAHSYSAEFQVLNEEEGLALLQNLAQLFTPPAGPSRLRDLTKLSQTPLECGLFAHDLPPASRPTDLFWPLLLAALCLFPFDVAVRRLNIEPAALLTGLGWLAGPLVRFVRRKKAQVAEAAAEVARSAAPEVGAPPPLMPTGSESRAAQSRYEQAGASDQAQQMDLKPQAAPGPPKAVGGTKLSPADESASEYTRALLRAKKKARKEGEEGR